MKPSETIPARVDNANARVAGMLVLLAVLGMVAFMAHHPLPEGNSQDLAKELSKDQAASAFVHGVLIAMMSVLLVGLTGLADCVGWNLLRLRAGLISYCLGYLGMTVSAICDGFILPKLAKRYVDSGLGSQEPFQNSIAFLFRILEFSAKFGILCLSLAVVMWSCILVFRSRSSQIIGAISFLAGMVPIALLLAGHLTIHFHEVMTFVIVQAIVYVAIAVQLIRGKL